MDPPAQEMLKLTDNYCFVCGQDNPQGLKIAVTYDAGDLAAETELSLPGVPGMG